MSSNTQVIENGSTYRIVPKEDLIIHQMLPAAVYIVSQSIMGYYLQKSEEFDVPEKLFIH